MSTPLPFSKFADFHSASKAVLEFLHKRIGFGLWMVTRTEGEEWIVLNSVDHKYDVAAGDVFRWMDSYCSEMVKGNGPRIAPRSNEIAVYKNAAIGQQVPIAAYVGVPLAKPDGSLFGTLCAIDPAPQPNAIVAEQPLIELLAGMLATLLDSELCALAETRRAEQANVEAMTDSLTGLFNRRGWEKLVEAEEARCRRYGHPACVFSIDVDGLKATNDQQGHALGDQMLVDVANAMLDSVREPDVVARIGGDEFAILAVECDADNAVVIKNRLQNLLRAKSINVSVGYSIRSAKHTLNDAMQIADEKMYEEKRDHKHSVDACKCQLS